MPQTKLEAPKFAVPQKEDDAIIGWTQGKGYNYQASLKKLQEISKSLGTLEEARSGKREAEKLNIAPFAQQLTFGVATRAHFPVENRLVALQILAKLGKLAADAADPLSRTEKQPETGTRENDKLVSAAAKATLKEIEVEGGARAKGRRERRGLEFPGGSGGASGQLGRQSGSSFFPRLP